MTTGVLSAHPVEHFQQKKHALASGLKPVFVRSTAGGDRPRALRGDPVAGGVAADAGSEARTVAPALISASVIAAMLPPCGTEISSAAPSKAWSGTATTSASGRQRLGGRGAPARDPHAPDLDLGHHGVVGDARQHEHRQRGRMVVALHERQPGDDLGRAVELERVPPGAGAGHREGRHQAEIAGRIPTPRRPPRRPPYGPRTAP